MTSGSHQVVWFAITSTGPRAIARCTAGSPATLSEPNVRRNRARAWRANHRTNHRRFCMTTIASPEEKLGLWQRRVSGAAPSSRGCQPCT